ERGSLNEGGSRYRQPTRTKGAGDAPDTELRRTTKMTTRRVALVLGALLIVISGASGGAALADHPAHQPAERPEWVRADGTVDPELVPAEVPVYGRDGEVLGWLSFGDAVAGRIPAEWDVQPEPECRIETADGV